MLKSLRVFEKYSGNRVLDWTGLLDWNTGLDYWTEYFCFFGQVCVYFSANLEALFKKLLLYSMLMFTDKRCTV